MGCRPGLRFCLCRTFTFLFLTTPALLWPCVWGHSTAESFCWSALFVIFSCMLPLILTRILGFDGEKHPHSMILLPPYFTAGMVLIGVWPQNALKHAQIQYLDLSLITPKNSHILGHFCDFIWLSNGFLSKSHPPIQFLVMQSSSNSCLVHLQSTFSNCSLYYMGKHTAFSEIHKKTCWGTLSLKQITNMLWDQYITKHRFIKGNVYSTR